MYFSATSSSDSSKHCIGAATATSVTGPYTPISSSALICPLSQGGAIDASGYYDQATGNRYITYKIDGNSIGYGGACGNDGEGPLYSQKFVANHQADRPSFQWRHTSVLRSSYSRCPQATA